MRTGSLTLIALSAIYATPAGAASPAGDWLVAERTAVVRIAPCKDAWCGKLTWTSETAADEHQLDPAKRPPSLIGTTILIDMRPNGTNRWDGEIYNPENGNTYTGHIQILGPDVLHVEGCLLGILCGGENWTRAGESTPAPRAQKPAAGTANKP